MKRAVLGLVLVAVPVSALGATAPVCGAPSQAAGDVGVALPGALQVLALEERLFHRLSGDEADGLEVRFLVEGAPYLVEEVDLAASEPRRVSGGAALLGRRAEGAADPAAGSGEERMIELLALRPDLVRELHARAAAGVGIDVEVAHAGRTVESFPFAELLRRSAELRESAGAQVVVRSRVTGAGADGGAARRVFAATYLDDCSMCTEETPCDTECGYDPGKGGPVTCGEYGVCVPGACSCELVFFDGWTDWYPIRQYSGGFLECYRVSGGWSQYHEDWWTEWRRDRIRRTWVCPSCPSCDGCHTVEETIDYQITRTLCKRDTGLGCSFGDVPCCSRLCSAFSWTVCESAC